MHKKAVLVKKRHFFGNKLKNYTVVEILFFLMQKSSFLYNYTVVKNRFNRNLISFFRFIYLVICNGTELCMKILNWGSSEDTVFIRISAQPRISTHPTPLPPTKTSMRDNKRPSRRRSFLQGLVQKPCFVTSSLKLRISATLKVQKFNKPQGG